jgi:sister chromatid cohesion protein DCC1
MLEEIEKGGILTFKGAINDKVVLCTRNKTYDIKEAQQSNSLLVIPNLLSAEKTTGGSPLKSPPGNNINKSLDKSLEDDEESSLPVDHEIKEVKIQKIFFNYLEMRQVKPQVKKVQELLHLTLYTGPENEHLIERKYLFTRRQLFETSQCSAGEFDELINKIRGIKINGHMRLLDYAYEFRVVTLMTSMLNENSWELDEVDRKETIEALDGLVPVEICEAVFDYYSIPLDTGKFRYKEEMVCRIIAQNVLQEGLKFHIDEFLDTCQEGLPNGMQMDETYLGGIGVVDRDSVTPSVRGLFEENMPMNLMERFQIIFKIKEKWTKEQISPYVEAFTTPNLQVTALLAKFCRSVTENGVRFYVAKHK